MELEELQSAWSQMSTELEQQKKLTNDIIMKMTQEKYRNKFNTLTNYESIGAIFCYAVAIMLLWNFEKLDTWYLQTCGIVSLMFLTILPTLVLRSLFKIRRLDIIKGSFRDNLLNYTKAKNNLLRLQQLAIGIGFVMMFLIVPVSSKILSEKDIFQADFKMSNWVGIILALLFMIIFCNWGYRGYKKVTESAESILKDLQ
jgi:hypothetical protein